jgi:hypothetical protein
MAGDGELREVGSDVNILRMFAFSHVFFSNGIILETRFASVQKDTHCRECR